MRKHDKIIVGPRRLADIKAEEKLDERDEDEDKDSEEEADQTAADLSLSDLQMEQPSLRLRCSHTDPPPVPSKFNFL